MSAGRGASIAMLVLMTTSNIEPVLASTLEKLVMPGAVIDGHAEFEADCERCHVRGRELNQNDLCLDCHVEVAADVKDGKGFHGLNPSALGADCIACHTDHEGRDAEIVQMNPAVFDHNFTDFVLRGAHLLATCSQCHLEAVNYREAATTCVACHQEDDIHMGSLGPHCHDCHSETDWVTSKFNHNKTNFPLLGKHVGLACDSCHRQDDDFSAAPIECSACHGKDDVHAGIAGSQCASCHNSADWRQTRFDHDAVSGFPLVGGHENIGCQECHNQSSLDDLGGADCNSCHRDDDIHKGSNGPQCLDCHTVNRWDELTFDHSAAANFALLGAHRSIDCNACHTRNLTEPLEKTCVGCHGGDQDPHRGQLGAECHSCHTNESWTETVRFDHDLVEFPLLGQHADLRCDDCHASPAFHDIEPDCDTCHGDQDVHSGRLGSDCGRCHNPTDWSRVVFDHNRQTTFPLDGAHVQVRCEACHRTTASAPQVCGQCHRPDDIHSGRFGDDCGRCHRTTAFRDLKEY